jgi:type IV secretory pathway VirJ component
MEIHLADMIGTGKKRSMDVLSELNKMVSVPVHAILGDEDNSFPLSSVQLRTFSYTIDAGGHHFNGDTKSLTEIITAHL